MKVDRLWTNARIATLDPARPGLGIIENAALAAGRPHRLGRPAAPRCRRLTPPSASTGGPLDHAGPDRLPHPLVYGGNRAHEFELRLAGATYEEIARAGGGIVSTVKATRAASEDELVARPCPVSTR